MCSKCRQPSKTYRSTSVEVARELKVKEKALPCRRCGVRCFTVHWRSCRLGSRRLRASTLLVASKLYQARSCSMAGAPWVQQWLVDIPVKMPVAPGECSTSTETEFWFTSAWNRNREFLWSLPMNQSLAEGLQLQRELIVAYGECVPRNAPVSTDLLGARWNRGRSFRRSWRHSCPSIQCPGPRMEGPKVQRALGHNNAVRPESITQMKFREASEILSKMSLR